MHGSTAQHLGPPGRIPGRPKSEAWPKKKTRSFQEILQLLFRSLAKTLETFRWFIKYLPKNGEIKKKHVVFHNAELLIPQELEPSTWNPEHCNSKQLIWRGLIWRNEEKDCPTTTPGKKKHMEPHNGGLVQMIFRISIWWLFGFMLTNWGVFHHSCLQVWNVSVGVMPQSPRPRFQPTTAWRPMICSTESFRPFWNSSYHHSGCKENSRMAFFCFFCPWSHHGKDKSEESAWLFLPHLPCLRRWQQQIQLSKCCLQKPIYISTKPKFLHRFHLSWRVKVPPLAYHPPETRALALFLVEVTSRGHVKQPWENTASLYGSREVLLIDS